MPRSQIFLSVKLLQSQQAQAWDMQFVCQRPYVTVRHSVLPPQDAVVIAFTHTAPPTPWRNLHLSPDYYSPLYQATKHGIERHTNSSSFLVSSPKFLLTDVVASSAEGVTIPLYYKHILPLDARQDGQVVIYDQDFQPLEEIPYLHQHTGAEHAVFNNLVSSYDPRSGVYKVYYVSYLDATGTRRFELLNNVPAFDLLKVESYDQLDPRRRFYSLTTRQGYYLVTCLFDFQKYSPTPSGLMYYLPAQTWGDILLPVDSGPDYPWMPQISRLDFYWQGQDGHHRRYEIAEFDYQNFSPYYPYKFISRIPGKLLQPRLIKAPHTRLHVDPDNGFHLECLVFQGNGQLKYALTTDRNKILYVDQRGRQTGIRYRTDGFASIDESGGFIQLSSDLDISDQIYLTYNYEEEHFSYSWLNLNPRFDTRLLEQEGLIYVTPQRIFTRLTNIYVNPAAADGLTVLEELVEDAFGESQVLKTYTIIQPDLWFTSDIIVLDAGSDVLDSGLVGNLLKTGKVIITNSVQYTALKTALEITIDDTTIQVDNLAHRYVPYSYGLLVDAGLDSNPLGISYSDLNLTDRQSLIQLWRSLYDLQVQRLAQIYQPDASLFHLILNRDNLIVEANHPFLSLTGLTLQQFREWFTISGRNANQYIILGFLKLVSGGLKAHHIKHVDCRQRGGGYRDGDHFPQLLAEYPEISWCLDYARVDGHPFAGAAAILIELPYTVLENYGGLLTHEEISRRARKYLAAGVYPVIRYYGAYDPRITQVIYHEDAIELTWEDTGGPYTVYWGYSFDNLPYSQVVTTNTFRLEGVKDQFHYTILVTPIRHNSRMLAQEPLDLVFLKPQFLQLTGWTQTAVGMPAVITRRYLQPVGFDGTAVGTPTVFIS